MNFISKYCAFFQKQYLFFVLLLILFPFNTIKSEFEIYLKQARNGGLTIEEIGSKTPINSFRGGGSRLTYRRDYSYIKTGFVFSYNAFELDTNVSTTGKYTDSGGARDEDFYLTESSSVRGSKISIQDGVFYDTPYTFSGTVNFADGYVDTRMTEYTASLFLRYFPWRSKAGAKSNSGLFFSAGLRHFYVKYKSINLYQFYHLTAPNPFFIYVPGKVQTFTYTLGEALPGMGYRIVAQKWRFELLFHPLVGAFKARDNHKYRLLNVFFTTYGSGFYYRLEGRRRIFSSVSIGCALYGHRYYSRGYMRIRGGITRETILIGFLGHSNAFINIKEAGAELIITKAIN